MYCTEFCEVSYQEELNVAYVIWKKFCCGEDYREPLLYAIDIMNNHEGCNYLADTRNGFEDLEEDTKWIFEEFIPRTAATGCEYIFFIINRENSLKEELEGQSVELSKHFKVRACFDLSEVKDILEMR
jgi:hypothetical protein